MLNKAIRITVALWLTLAGLAGLQSIVGVPPGLLGTYYASTDWSGQPIFTNVDASPSTDALLSAWFPRTPSVFSATWSGTFITPRDSTYTFSTVSTDDSWVYIDEKLAVSNPGQPGNRLAQRTIQLTRGVHRVFVGYVQNGGPFGLQLLWDSGAGLRPMPAWIFTTGHPGFIRFVSSVIVRRVLTVVEWLAVAMSVVWLLTLVVHVNALGPQSPLYSYGLKTLLAAAAAVAAVATVYVATAGLFPQWPDAQTQLYNLQADGFLDHQTSIKVAPSANLWDTSYYNGRNFIYWGPVPALMVAAVKLLAGSSNAIQDNVVATVFAVGLLMAKLMLLFLVGSRLFPDLRALWASALSFMVMALAAPSLFIMARPAIYEASILAGQFFLLAGICAALFGLAPEHTRRRRNISCLVAGTCWALAIGCRVTTIPAVAILVPATAIAYGLVIGGPGIRRAIRQSFGPFCFLAVPVLLAGLGLGVFNKVRFDSWTEFGVEYQTTSMKASWTGRFVLPNLYSYLFRTPRVSCTFPFISAHWGYAADAFPRYFSIPPGYSISEPVMGLAWLAPCFALGAIALISLLAWSVRAIQTGTVDRSRVSVHWLTFCALTLATAGGIAVLGMPLATMRYGGDVSTGLSALSLLGLFLALERLQHGRRLAYRAFIALVLMLAAYTVTAGLLSGVEGYYGQFRNNNPRIYRAWTEFLSLPGCWRESSEAPHAMRRSISRDGPAGVETSWSTGKAASTSSHR